MGKKILRSGVYGLEFVYKCPMVQTATLVKNVPKACKTTIAGAKRYSSPVLSVKRSIKMKNTGATTLYVRGFEVEGIPCEGYGFKVLNCQGFDLPPLEVKEIDIAFSPDFTLTKVTRKLTILSNINKDMVRKQDFVNLTFILLPLTSN